MGHASARLHREMDLGDDGENPVRTFKHRIHPKIPPPKLPRNHPWLNFYVGVSGTVGGRVGYVNCLSGKLGKYSRPAPIMSLLTEITITTPWDHHVGGCQTWEGISKAAAYHTSEASIENAIDRGSFLSIASLGPEFYDITRSRSFIFLCLTFNFSSRVDLSVRPSELPRLWNFQVPVRTYASIKRKSEFLYDDT